MRKYLAVIEKADYNYSAFSPDIPGCGTVGDTIEETLKNLKEAIELSLEYDLEKGDQVPKPKGLVYHINNGIFDEDNIAEDYFITQVEIEDHQLIHA
ncbi:MAG: type II toxin-antitoxin system HicB family antitoxin [Chitinophagaceae bacterium]|nr:MAG: type II toxin-antitoxin system HicB family antitoxin [Chitinophagaceae bacterium]